MYGKILIKEKLVLEKVYIRNLIYTTMKIELLQIAYLFLNEYIH